MSTENEKDVYNEEFDDGRGSARMLGIVMIAMVLFYGGIGLWFFL